MSLVLQDFGGFYDRDKLFWREIHDVTLSAACAPPGGGRNPVTPRLIRHFAMLSIPSPSEHSLKHMFLVSWIGWLDIIDLDVYVTWVIFRSVHLIYCIVLQIGFVANQQMAEACIVPNFHSLSTILISIVHRLFSMDSSMTSHKLSNSQQSS